MGVYNSKINTNMIPGCEYITHFNGRILKQSYPEILFTITSHISKNTILTKCLAVLRFIPTKQKVDICVYKYNHDYTECSLQEYSILYKDIELHFDQLINSFLQYYNFTMTTNFNSFHDTLIFTKEYYDTYTIDIARNLLKMAKTYIDKISYPSTQFS